MQIPPNLPPTIPPTGPLNLQGGNNDDKAQALEDLDHLLKDIEELKKSGGELSPREKVRFIKLCERLNELAEKLQFQVPGIVFQAQNLLACANANTDSNYLPNLEEQATFLKYLIIDSSK